MQYVSVRLSEADVNSSVMSELTFLVRRQNANQAPQRERIGSECVNPHLGRQQCSQKIALMLIDWEKGLNTNCCTIDASSIICITHVHGDHCYGLPGLLATMHARTEPLILIAPKPIELLDTVSLTTELHSVCG